MGSVSAKKCFDVINNVKKIIAIEFLCASQGIDFLRPMKSGKGAEEAYLFIRNKMKHITHDTITGDLIMKMTEIVFDERFLMSIENKIGKLES